MFRYASLGMEFAGGIAGFVLIGYWIDRSWGTAPKGVVTAAALGCIGGMYVLIRRGYELARKLDPTRSQERDDDDHPDPTA